MTPEGKVKKEVDKLLHALDVFFWAPPATVYGVKGVSDRIAVINGRILAVEVKAANKEPTALQEQFMRNIRNAGGFTFVAWPQNLGSLELTVRKMQGWK